LFETWQFRVLFGVAVLSFLFH